MHATTKLFPLVLLALLSACTQTQDDSANPASSDAEVNQVDSIRLYAQSRPGGEHFDFMMPIDKGLDALIVANRDSVQIDENELVLGLLSQDKAYAIPIFHLSGFEVANLRLPEDTMLVTWCPLVGTARAFDADINKDHSGFDFGRGLRENNLLIVDRKTKSVWNQLSTKALKGSLEGDALSPLPGMQTTWSYWKSKYPDTELVINSDTSNAVFPSYIFEKPYYNTWTPGEQYPAPAPHQLANLGLGIELADGPVFFSLNTLFSEDSPQLHETASESIQIFSDSTGLTAWAMDASGRMLPSVLTYQWAWDNFYPESKHF